MNAPVMPLLVFATCYALFVVLPRWRSVVACAGGLFLVLTGSLTWREALLSKIHWNVVALFFGTLVLAELFMQSRMPAVLAEALVLRTRTVRAAMLAVCLLAGALSVAVENVAVVLLVAPVALSLADRLKISPVRLLICIAVSTNLQGTATLIGDPPSMILAGYLKMTFNDFFFYHGRWGIFFAVQIGGLAGFAVLAWLLRAHGQPTVAIAREKVRAWTPSALLGLLILGLSSASRFDPGFRWLAGTLTLALAGAGLVWFQLVARWSPIRDLIRSLDWDTTFFLMGVFVLVGAMSDSGWLDRLASWISQQVGTNLFQAFLLINLTAMLVSAVVDNVPFLLAMIPVTQKVADYLQVPVPLLLFGLLIGACLGGNITPVGASANLVAVGLLKKRGHVVGFGEFMAVGLPFTLAAVLAASVFVWWIWAP